MELFLNLPDIIQVLIAVFAAVFFIQVYYYLYYYSGMIFYNRKIKKGKIRYFSLFAASLTISAVSDIGPPAFYLVLFQYYSRNETEL